VALKTRTIRINDTLLGTWITENEDSNAAFTVSAKNNRYRVAGFCRSDGEMFEITRVKWDGKALSFIARMPSTKAVSKNVFRIRQDGKLDLELTTYEVWKKKDIKAGEIPTAWQRRSVRPTQHKRSGKPPW
jgi:hypothetical protein